MRILHVSSARTFGGGERHFVDLTRGLAARGHEVFAAFRPTCEWKHELDFLPHPNLYKVSIRNSFGILSAMRIADFVRENKIDIVHAHVARDYIPASIACLASNAEFVLTRHLMLPLKPFNRFALKNLCRAIAVSDGVAVELRKVFPKEKIVVIHNGIDITSRNIESRDDLRNEFRTFHGIPLDAPLIGTLGELKQLKGQREFVLAAAEITKTQPECRFVVVGRDNSADKKFRRDLKRLVEIMGLKGKFLWLDWLDDARPFHAGIDVFVSPSRSESFGLAMLEAIASGAPVVATETDGAKQLLGMNGDLVPVEDPVALARAVDALIRDQKYSDEIAARGLKRAQTMFDVERMVVETEGLYEEILKEKR
ncbi:MAG: glycosyltransferase family 4 protein [Pyrinomonadaceae bacterium]